MQLRSAHAAVCGSINLSQLIQTHENGCTPREILYVQHKIIVNLRQKSGKQVMTTIAQQLLNNFCWKSVLSCHIKGNVGNYKAFKYTNITRNHSCAAGAETPMLTS